MPPAHLPSPQQTLLVPQHVSSLPSQFTGTSQQSLRSRAQRPSLGQQKGLTPQQSTSSSLQSSPMSGGTQSQSLGLQSRKGHSVSMQHLYALRHWIGESPKSPSPTEGQASGSPTTHAKSFFRHVLKQHAR
mmetsp:Transcript_11246/g.41681  ORF Transcript_11246/g.41681 Transcript_11246/m.41681 type:complete len:131 (+) Transcript_11246:1279-1671(+)